MPHLDIIKDENLHRAIAETERVYGGGEAFFALWEQMMIIFHIWLGACLTIIVIRVLY